MILENSESIDSIVNFYVENDYYPFVYVRVEQEDGSVLYEHSSINEKLLPSQIINKDTWIRVWSMSKIITITTVMDLVEDGILDLADPVTDYIPEFQNLKVAVGKDGNSISTIEIENVDGACPYQLVPMDSVMTLSHLINHKAGFYYFVSGYPCLDSLGSALRVPEAQSSQEFIDRIAQLPLAQQPGERYYYGLNTTILGIVAERATSKSLASLVEDRVTGPLGIQGLQYGVPDEATLLPKFSGADTILRRANEGELDIFGPAFPIYTKENKLYLGGEGMVATTDGYVDFIHMLANYGKSNGHRFLEKETIEEIASPHTLVDNSNGYNGYNLWVTRDSSEVVDNVVDEIWLGGGYEQTHFWVDPKRKLVGVIMSQMFSVQEGGYHRDGKIRKAIYKEIHRQEAKNNEGSK